MWGIRQVTRWLIYVLVAGMPWVVFPPLREPFEFPKVLFYLLILLFSLLVNIDNIIYMCIKYVKNRDITVIALLIWLGVLGLSSLASQDMLTSFLGQPFRYWGWLSLVLLGGLFIVVRSSAQFGLHTRVMKQLLAFCHVLVVLVIFVQAGLFLAGVPVYTFNGHMTAFLGNPNFAAQYLVLTLPFAWYYIWGLRQNTRRKYIVIGLLLSTFLALFLTNSRAGLAVFGLEVAVLGFQFLVESRWRWILIGAVALLTILGVAWMFSTRTPSAFDTRSNIWEKGYQAVLDKPLLGWGVEQFAPAFSAQLQPDDFDLQRIRVDRAHNDVLETLVAGGILAGIAYVVFWGSMLWRMWQKRHARVAWLYLTSLGAFLLMAQVNVVSSAVYMTGFVVAGLAMQWFDGRENSTDQ